MEKSANFLPTLAGSTQFPTPPNRQPMLLIFYIFLHFLNIQANMYIYFIPFPTFFFYIFALNKYIQEQ